MRQRSLAGFVLVVALAVSGSEARAQVFVGAGGPVALTPGYGYGSAYVAPAYGLTPVYGTSYSGYVAPYSYYVLPPTVPSRTYIGPDIYPFYGRPYGHPYDRWTWPYISGGPDANLARYYYPPLG